MTKVGYQINDLKGTNLETGAKGGAIAFVLKIFATLLGFMNQVLHDELLKLQKYSDDVELFYEDTSGSLIWM